jgi:hypothetical protein
MSKEFPLHQVLELACAAQRVNNAYIKEVESIFDIEGKFLFMKHSNKSLVRKALKLADSNNTAPEFAPHDISIEDTDRELANEIQKYFKRLMFAAVKGDNEFQMEVNTLLTLAVVPDNKIGFIACLPSVYKRDSANNQIEKRARSADKEYLSAVGSSVFDKDCEILASQRSKNFDAWNVDAIIDNKMVSWFSKVDMKVGPCVVVKSKVKDHSLHWKYGNPVTRLNYVKAVQ